MERIELEFIIKSSPIVLFDRLSRPDGLAEWFADSVVMRGDIYEFVWNGQGQEARLLKIDYTAGHIQFQWTDGEEDAFFEFRLETDELTNDLSLFIVDHVEDDEVDEMSDLWTSQVSKLKEVIGS